MRRLDHGRLFSAVGKSCVEGQGRENSGDKAGRIIKGFGIVVVGVGSTFCRFGVNRL